MAEERLQRQLAAILSADMVGYSRLMGIDEAGTIARLNALRRELIDPAIAAHSGRIVKLMGDGALIEFASAVDVSPAPSKSKSSFGSTTPPSQKAIRSGSGSGSTLAISSLRATISLATASISRHGSKKWLTGGISISRGHVATDAGQGDGQLYRSWRAEFEEYCSSGARLSVGPSAEGSVRARSGETTRAARANPRSPFCRLPTCRATRSRNTSPTVSVKTSSLICLRSRA